MRRLLMIVLFAFFAQGIAAAGAVDCCGDGCDPAGVCVAPGCLVSASPAALGRRESPPVLRATGEAPRSAEYAAAPEPDREIWRPPD
jgi:hypothetical protein